MAVANLGGPQPGQGTGSVQGGLPGNNQLAAAFLPSGVAAAASAGHGQHQAAAAAVAAAANLNPALVSVSQQVGLITFLCRYTFSRAAPLQPLPPGPQSLTNN